MKTYMFIADVQTDPDTVYTECEQLRQELQKCKKTPCKMPD